VVPCSPPSLPRPRLWPVGRRRRVPSRAFLGILVGAELLASVCAHGEQNRAPSGEPVEFDIPAQPLAQALDAYARLSGMAALFDQSLAAGRRSASVKGSLTADQALRLLLAGSGLSIRYASRSAFTLALAVATVAPALASPGGAGASGADRRAYFADLEDALAKALCRRPETEPGRYRLGVQLWIGPRGKVLASHLLDSTGDARRDVAIADTLAAIPVAAPPAALPQPVTIVLLPNSPGASACPGAEGRAE
jgi:Secretin and TonB N terminus short domain